jgi:hypothetical protein
MRTDLFDFELSEDRTALRAASPRVYSLCVPASRLKTALCNPAGPHQPLSVKGD